MPGNVEVQNASAIMADDEKAIEHAQGDRRNREEIHRSDGVAASSKIVLDLAPWELLFLEILPRPELVEPVALGARWYRDANGRVRIADGAGRVRPRVCLAASTCREDQRQWLGAATSALGGNPRQQLTMAPGPEVILDKSSLKSLNLV
jgi:hypothetical protein